MSEIKLIIVDPGHFHASLIQKEMYPGVSKQVSVFAPLGPDLMDHLGRVARFNLRPDNPTAWELDIHCEPNFFEHMLKLRPGNVVVFSGRNREKMDRIKASVEAGLNVLADKPWILKSADLPKMQAALDTAERQGLVTYDIMTERFEITSLLQREIVHDDGVFGQQVEGTPQEPGVSMESVHNIMKMVAGAPLQRPAWFFDIRQQGEGLSDVGTHVVDLAQWTLFPEQALDYRKDIRMLEAKRWPTALTKAEFQKVTGESEFPAYLSGNLKGGRLEYYCNNMVEYTLRGVRIKLNVLWNYEAPEGAGDSYAATFRGTKSRVEIRQGKAEGYRPELYVALNGRGDRAAVQAALQRKIAALQAKYPGLTIADLGGEWRIGIPEKYRVGHEAHFAQVANQFFGYLRNPKSVPSWEKPNMLAKYYVSTRGVEMGQEGRR